MLLYIYDMNSAESRQLQPRAAPVLSVNVRTIAEACPAIAATQRAPAGTFTCGGYSYTGDWVDDAMHGQGKFTFASGASYQGCFEHNKFSGQGTYTFPDGKQYQVGAMRQQY